MGVRFDPEFAPFIEYKIIDGEYPHERINVAAKHPESTTSIENVMTSGDTNKLQFVPENKSMVYIIRPKFLGKLIKIHVYCDSHYIGFTKGKTYLSTIVEPGKHTFLSKAENKKELQLVCEPNKTYFIEQIPRLGFATARNNLIMLDENEGMRKLQKCNLSKGIVK